MTNHRTPPMILMGLIATLLYLQIGTSCNEGPRAGTRDAQALRGKAIFDQQCIACHGSDQIAPTRTDLEKKPPDLSLIMERRRAKDFPIVEIAQIIDGRQWVKSHGAREMPVWGEVYDSLGLTDDEIRGKKGELVAYLMSIQK